MKTLEWCMKRVEKIPFSGCWIWMGDNSEYGRIEEFGVIRGAHRLIYEKTKGPIPDDLVIDHLCRVKLCVNPGHMEPVTNKENILRGISPSARNARATICVNGHELSIFNTRWRSYGGRACKKCELKSFRKQLKLATAIAESACTPS